MEEVGRADLGSVGRMLLHAPTYDLVPGETIRGIVELSLAELPLLVRGVWIKLQGKTNVLNKDGEMNTVNLLRDDEEYHNGGITEVFVGFGEIQNSNEVDILELTERSYSWHFVFKLPDECPFSYCDSFTETTYTLTATLDTPSVPLSIGTLCHTLVVGALTHASLETIDTPSTVLGYQAQPESARQELEDAQIANAGCSNILSYLFGSPLPLPEVQMKLAQPAIFTFEDSRCTLPIRTLLKNLDRRKKSVSITYRIVLKVLTRPNEFIPFDNVETEYINDVDLQTQQEQSAKKKKNARGTSGVKQYITTLWKTEKKIRMASDNSNNKDEGFEVPVSIPIIIDTRDRSRHLRDWPVPSQLTHRYDDTARLLTFNSNSPLSRVSYSLHTTVSQSKITNRSDKTNRIISCCSESEIVVLPPQCLNDENVVETAYVSETVNLRQKKESTTTAAGAGVGVEDLKSDSAMTVSLTPAKTPQARIAPIRVVGELISRGPAAVLVDRGLRRPREVDPNQNFAVLTTICVNGATCITGTPMFSPALAFVCNTVGGGSMRSRTRPRTGPRSTLNSNDVDNDDMEDVFPTFTLNGTVETPFAARTMTRINEETNSERGESPAVSLSGNANGTSRLFSPVSPQEEETKYGEVDDNNEDTVTNAGSPDAVEGGYIASTSPVPVAPQNFITTLGRLFTDNDDTNAPENSTEEGQQIQEGNSNDDNADGAVAAVNYDTIRNYDDVSAAVTYVQSRGGGVLGFFHDCILHRVPVREITAPMCISLLSLITSTSDREAVLLVLIKERWLADGALIALFEEGGCVDSCFHLNVQRERVKSQIRHEALSVGQLA
jgi:hypothetical protein